MILCTREKERIFADNVPVIVLSGAFKREFRELLLKMVGEKKSWTKVRKKMNASALDFLKKKYQKLKQGDAKGKLTDEEKSQLRSMKAFSTVFKRFSTNNKL